MDGVCFQMSDDCMSFHTHVSGELVRFRIPVGPKDGLPFVDEVVCMGHTMLEGRNVRIKKVLMSTVSGTQFSCVIENCPLCVRM